MAIKNRRNLGYLSQSKLFYIFSARTSHFVEKQISQENIAYFLRCYQTRSYLPSEVMSFLILPIPRD